MQHRKQLQARCRRWTTAQRAVLVSTGGVANNILQNVNTYTFLKPNSESQGLSNHMVQHKEGIKAQP